MKAILLTVTLLLSTVSYADQCEWNSPSDAEAATALINLHKDIIYWCQNCGDPKPSSIVTVSAARAPKVDDKYNIGKGKPYRYVVVTANGKSDGIDLAYTYVRTASDTFANLAHLTGCPSEGATTFIQTTNTNKKISHFYNAVGIRQDVTTTTASVDFKSLNSTNRVPANKK